MASGQKRDLSGYNYGAISSLVLTADRSALPRRDREPDGAPETLVGRIDPKQMGDRVQRETPKDLEKKKKKAAAQDGTEKATRLKTLFEAETLKDFDKKKLIEEITGTIPNDSFAQLVSLSKKITDYSADDETMADPDMERKDAEIDDELGVAVVFEEEEEEEEDEDGGYEIRDESDDEEGGEDEAAGALETAEDEAVVLGGESKRAESAAAASDKVSPHDIDGFWLQRLLSATYTDAVAATDKTTAALQILSAESGLRDCENELMELFDYRNDMFNVVNLLTKNRDVIVWCTKLARSDDNERANVEVAMREKNVGWILKALAGGRNTRANGDAMDVAGEEHAMDVDPKLTKNVPATATLAPGSTTQPRKTVDLEGMAFSQGGHLNSNKKVKLPEGSFKRTKKGYEEIHIPEPKPRPAVPGELVEVSRLPTWAQDAFPGMPTLNRIQSKLFPVAFGQDDPILLCAPTGAGKTNVAMLTVLNELAKSRDEETGTFAKRLQPFGVKVGELTGDSQLTKQQISETQIIVTTPEKWDVITRKSTDTSYTNLVRLVIIDEIHLLHDDRGPVLESIIARTIRRMEQNGEYVRLVGLSATLPNYKDVAKFLRVDEKKGLFYFDATYRPCGLRQEFIGVTEKKAIKRYQVMNEVCYEKVLDHAGKNQVLVFVHSRKETAKTAKFIRDMALEKETITQFVKPESATREILQTEVEGVKDRNLIDLLPFGFGIHHAGMTREDRTLVEDLFGSGHLQVLVCTATLAWGVNLPAHTVIIKGTQIYNPEKGRWTELSSQDMLQMLGRAGRPQYDTFGEGVIITNHSELQYYLSLLNEQLPIESQFVAKLADNLNAEIVLGNVRNRDEAIQWLGYTYLYVRMLQSPVLYGIGIDYSEDDPHLIQKRANEARWIRPGCRYGLRYPIGRSSPPEIGELIGIQSAGVLVHRFVHSFPKLDFPKLDLQAHVQPITRSLLRIDLTITPDFRWDERAHGTSQAFWIIVEDVDGEIILFHDQFVLRQRYAQAEHTVTLTIPMFEPVPPNYYVSLVSDRWLHSETRLPISFKHLILPEKFPAPTPLLDLQPLPVVALRNKEFESIYAPKLETFNKIQTQVFQALYNSDEHVLIGAPTGSGKTICAEFALMRLWQKPDAGRAVCIEPYADMVEQRVTEWRAKFGNVQGGKEIVSLTGETSADLRQLELGDVIICTPEQIPNSEIDFCASSGTSFHADGDNARTCKILICLSATRFIYWAPKLDPRLPSRRQCRLTADDILTYCAADGNEDRFLNIEMADLEPHLERVSEPGLVETLKHGVGYYHEALSKQDKRIVERLFEAGAIQLVIASRETCWSLPLTAYMVVIMGVQHYEGREHRYVDYPVPDVLQMMGRACRPGVDASSRCVLMCQQTRKEFYKKFLSEGLPIESHLTTNLLHDWFLAEAAVKTIENKQDATDILTWTYFYRRMMQNPNYYNLNNLIRLQDILTWTYFYRRMMQNPNYYNLNNLGHDHLSDYLSELVENTLSELANSNCIAIEDEMDVSPLNLGMIAAYYNISYVTVHVYEMSLKETTKLKGLLEIVSSSAEFESIPIRRHEDGLLRRIYERVPVKLGSVDYDAPYFKTFLLLQAHFSRLTLPPDLAADQAVVLSKTSAIPHDLAADQAVVLSKVLNLLSACVDVLRAGGRMNATHAMDLSQMCVQAVWESDSPLKQIPHFDAEGSGEAVYDVMEMEDDQRNEVLRMDARQMRDVAAFVNAYPSLEVSYELVEGEYTAGAPISMSVTLARDAEDDDGDDQTVVAPFYPSKKMAQWWIVVGEPKTKQLLTIKRVTVAKTLKVKLEFALPAGEHRPQLLVICDSYMGADHDIRMEPIAVGAAVESDEDEDEDEDMSE
ncbi:hypothetical protein RSAG8_01319, partial [Rhizoctonia solani AG-8 WAC10335]